jgi:hypothetical protein
MNFGVDETKATTWAGSFFGGIDSLNHELARVSPNKATTITLAESAAIQ